MKNFKCDACGYEYSDSHNYTSCPNCAGLGKTEPNCTCIHYSKAFGAGKLNLIAKKDPACPVHSSKN